MSMMFLAAMMMAQAPATTQPLAPAQPVAANARAKQVCEYEETVSSHAKKRVCHDVEDTDSGAKSSSLGNTKVETIGTPGSGTLASH
jgi:hypothetical protein